MSVVFVLDLAGASPAIATVDKAAHERAATSQEIVLASVCASALAYWQPVRLTNSASADSGEPIVALEK